MKKIIFLLLIVGNIFVYSYEKAEKIENEIKKIDKIEEKNMNKTSEKKEILEEELNSLQNTYNIRAEKMEKLKENSKTGWNRDEYKKILKKYEKIQNEEMDIINKKSKELKVIDQGLSIMNKDNQEVLKQ